MLIVKNLKKTYKTKGGVVVHALDDVSITFPESGMVFLLGKSGSGKSTLLNMIGGLDRVDSGEIIVKGKNSKTFSGADYDSYRNTYIGFIFQEYNILNEFNIEQNISLALQLQGKPNDKKAVEAILEQVDLAGLGKRKPNTLSGGQKQRVAIARALIKNPEIIMADEPTGALDSNTGKQVFETLKKLSRDKLVIVVSHDRDFAEHYGDRIIELSDGKIISDTTKEYIEPQAISENVHVVNDHTIAIKDVTKLSDSDMKVILGALKNGQGEAVISSGEHDLPLVRQVIHLKDDNTSEVFNETKDVPVKEYDPKQTKFIRSKLPMSRAFKMGSSSLKLKPVRLIFTTLLTSIALAMFGLASTLMLFKESYSISQALQKSVYQSEVISKYYNATYRSYNLDIETGEIRGDNSYPNTRNTLLDEGDISHLNSNNVGHRFAGLITFDEASYGKSACGSINLKNSSETNDYYYYNGVFAFSDAGEGYLNSANMNIIAGSYPTASDELLISEYHYQLLKLTSDDVNDYNDILGKEYTLYIRGNYGSTSVKTTIKGVYNSGSIPEKFNALKNSQEMNRVDLNELKESFNSYLLNSFQAIVFVSPDFYETYKDNLYHEYDYYQSSYSLGMEGVMFNSEKIPAEYNVRSDQYQSFVSSKVFDYVSKPVTYDINGEIASYVTPKEDEVYLSYSFYTNRKEQQLREYYYGLGRIADSLVFDKDAYDQYQKQADELRNMAYRLADYVYGNYYPEEYDYKKDKQLADEIIDTYFDKTVQKQYVFDLADKLRTGFQSENGYYVNEDDYPEYKDFSNKVSAARASTPYDMSNYESIKNYVLADSDHYLEHFLLYEYSSYYNEENDDNYRARDIRNKYNNQQKIEESEWDFLREFIDKYVNLSGYNMVKPDLNKISKMPAINIDYCYYKTYNGKSGRLKVIGFVQNGEYLLNHDFALSLGSIDRTEIYVSETTSEYQKSVNAKYAYAITHTSFSQDQIAHLLSNTKAYGYKMTDDVYNSLMVMLNLISTLKQVFLISGIVFGTFAALMLFNFISTSISAKTKEIGILRAVGARGNDLFKIFFSESGLIALICSIIAIATSIIVCWRLNVMMQEEVGLSMLNFGPINIGLILAGAIVIAIIGTLVPVIIAAKKPPVESIRTL